MHEAIRAVGARLVSAPRNIPDLNPIEKVLAKLKRLMRKAPEQTVEAVGKRLGTVLDSFSTEDCANCLRNAACASA